MLGLGALSAASAPAAAPNAAPSRAESLLIVDCLLPGRVQRLGARATYVTARRAVKITAAGCAVRGGEYTAADRATLASAVNVWLPLAKAGDVEAQTNLGEIFEKGVGGQAQPDLAVQWYQLAAEQGSARAQVNLGALYERGLGVPRDPAKAAEWYRRASGLSAAQVPYVPVEAIETLKSEREALQRELEAERGERRRLEAELEALKGRLARERSAVESGLQDLEAARRELALRTQAYESQARRTSDTTQLEGLRRELDIQRRAVEARDAELRLARAAMSDLETQSGALQRRLEGAEARRVAEVSAAQAEVQAARAQAAALDERLKAAEAERVGGQARADAQRAEVERLRRELARVQGRSALERAQVEGRLQAREAELADSLARLDALKTDLARLQAEKAQRDQAAARPSDPRGGGGVERVSPAEFAFGRYHALIIGNNAYRHLQALETAVHDARTVDEILRGRYGFKTTLLINADRYQLLSALNQLREQLSEGDNLLIYYAGHGELDRVNNRGYWLPVDAETNSSANWISSIQITDVLNAMTAKQILLVADSCYSGVLTRAAIARLDAGMSEEERLRWLKAMATKRARVVLTSGGVQPVLDGGGGDHSVFAQAFISALRENSGILESQRLAQAVTQRVAVTAAAASIDQVPVYAPIRFAGHEAGDFFFVARN
ncbi:caspase family protein [Phenylobacterium sp.]|uniref:caspase family protein n=1 Tax=Phenylobacterium sp. TaxID=1871053 RepID=UPI002EDB1C9F